MEIYKKDFYPVDGCLCGVTYNKILDESRIKISIPAAEGACGQKNICIKNHLP